MFIFLQKLVQGSVILTILMILNNSLVALVHILFQNLHNSRIEIQRKIESEFSAFAFMFYILLIFFQYKIMLFTKSIQLQVMRIWRIY